MKRETVEPQRRTAGHRQAGGMSGVPEAGGGQRSQPLLTEERRALVSRHIGLVGVHLRMRVPTPKQPMRHREYDDLFQEGCVALIRAAARYDPQRDGAFAAYALPRIRGAIHAALTDGFSIIRVPARAAALARTSSSPPGDLVQGRIQPLTRDVVAEIATDSPDLGEHETVRHALRQRFERAVRQAMADLQTRQWRRRNPCGIMARIAAERLLISNETERTPLRQIAREAGVSSGRASAYEHRLTETVKEHFTRDPQLSVLIRFAAEDAAGFQAVVDPRRRELLLQAELDAFEEQFRRLERTARAKLLYGMIEHSAAAMTEIARNLYRMTLSDETELLPAG